MKLKNICKNCNKEFYFYPSKQKGIYCSIVCRNTNRWGNNFKVKCLSCNKKFKTYKSRIKIGKGKYCSKNCYGISKQGQVGCRKGSKLTEEHKIKLSSAHKGQKGWWEGKKLSKEHRYKIGLGAKGRIPWNKGLHPEYMQKNNHSNWKGGITPFNLSERVKFRRTIQKQVLKKDNYTCQLCGIYGGNMTVDHIQSWAEYIELRFNINNCRTLCQSCHYKITFGKPMPPTVRAWGHNLFKGGSKKFA